MLDAGIKGPLLPQLDKTSENEIIMSKDSALIQTHVRAN